MVLENSKISKYKKIHCYFFKCNVLMQSACFNYYICVLLKRNYRFIAQKFLFFRPTLPKLWPRFSQNFGKWRYGRIIVTWRVVIHITNFIPSKDEILVQNTPTSLCKKNTGWCQWALIFSVDIHMELTPSPICIRSPEPNPLPLRVDVINGWPISVNDEVNCFQCTLTIKEL